MDDTKKYGSEFYGYETISEREEVFDPIQAEIVDYIERNFQDIKKVGDYYHINNSSFMISFNNTHITFYGLTHNNGINGQLGSIPTKILQENKVGLLASFRDYVKK